MAWKIDDVTRIFFTSDEHVRLVEQYALNPGSNYGEGVLLGALVNLEENGITSHMLTQVSLSST